MHHAQKARLAVIGALAAILLTGCAANADAPSQPATASTAAAGPQTQPEARRVHTQKVIDPVTVVVTPIDESDSLYGSDFTVHVDNITTPEKGACGYDDALTLAKHTLEGEGFVLKYDTVEDGRYIDGDDHYGRLDSLRRSYGQTMVSAGMATVPATSSLSRAQDDAKAAGTGLWASCPSFGE